MNAPVVQPRRSGVPIPWQPHVRDSLDERDNPRTEVRVGVGALLVFFVGLIGWAAVARLDAAAYAEGRLVVSGQRQTVQHRDGGIVRSIAVKEGQTVRGGEVLLQLDQGEVTAQERSLTAQAITLLAQKARLEAEQLGLGKVAVPAELLTVAGPDRSLALAAIGLQQRQLDTRRAYLSSQQSIIAQRSAQAVEQAKGQAGQSVAATEQERLIREELNALQPLSDKGFVAGNRIRALQRAEAALRGERARFEAEKSRSHEAATEARFSMLGAEREHLDRVAAELRQVESAWSELKPRLTAVRERVDRAAIRAPATGTVVGLAVFTPGGVIAPGQKLLDIVPDEAAMRIEARLSPTDSDDVVAGQEVSVRFTSLYERSIRPLRGTVTRVSADSFTDQRTGASYFTAEVTVSDDELTKLRGHVDRALALRAGTPVQMQIHLRDRTALQFALEPLVAPLWKSFGQQ